MSGYIRELLLDFSLNRLPVDLRSDLAIAIQQALHSVFTKTEAKYLDLYLAGYTAQEIAQLKNKTTEYIEQTLQRICTAIEETSGYRDDVLIRKVERDKHYRRSGVRELRTFLTVHGKDFNTHDVKGVY